MTHFNFEPKAPKPNNVSKVVDSLRDYLELNTGEEGFFRKYSIQILGSIATAGTVAVVAAIHLRHKHDSTAKQAARNIAHQAFTVGGDEVAVQIEVIDDGLDETT